MVHQRLASALSSELGDEWPEVLEHAGPHLKADIIRECFKNLLRERRESVSADALGQTHKRVSAGLAHGPHRIASQRSENIERA